MPVAVRGLQKLNRTFKHAPKETRAKIRQEYRTVAEPVQRAAERLAVSELARIGPVWSRMRVGITQRLVYVAPKARGARGRGDSRRRPRFGDLLMERAMEPALDENRHRIEHDFSRMLDRLVDGWDS